MSRQQKAADMRSINNDSQPSGKQKSRPRPEHSAGRAGSQNMTTGTRWQSNTAQIANLTQAQIQAQIALQMQAQSDTIKAARQKLSNQINQNQIQLHQAHLDKQGKHSRAVTQYANQTGQPKQPGGVMVEQSLKSAPGKDANSNQVVQTAKNNNGRSVSLSKRLAQFEQQTTNSYTPAANTTQQQFTGNMTSQQRNNTIEEKKSRTGGNSVGANVRRNQQTQNYRTSQNVTHFQGKSVDPAMQELIAQMNNVPLSRDTGMSGQQQQDFATGAAVTQQYNMGQILSPKDLVANQYGSNQPQSYSYLQQMMPFTGGQSNSLQHLSQNGSAVNMSGNTGRSYSQINRSSPNRGTQNNNLPEAALLQSEEHFETAKSMLEDKRYKEAVQEFSKSVQINPQNYDALFYRAVANLDFGQPIKSIEDLNLLLERCPDYRKTAFIVLSIAYRRVNDFNGALRALSRALTKYPRYIEASIARGQIYIFQQKWDKALSDFNQVVQIQPSNGLGYLGQGDSLKGIGNVEGALNAYTQAINLDEKSASQGLMKRGLLHLQLKQSKKALDDFSELATLAEQTSQPEAALSKAYFFKAKALKKLNNLSDSVLYFEQVVRAAESDNHLAASALYEIAKIKIQLKDFYEAYYNLKRATHFKLKQKKLVNFRIFTEGVIFLMKRKTKTGHKLITQLIDRLPKDSAKQEALDSDNETMDAPGTGSDFIQNLMYIYRAYANFVLEDYDASMKDYLRANQIQKLGAPAQYNMLLAQGLKALGNKEFENAISFFTKANAKQQVSRDPFLLRGISLIRFAYNKSMKTQTKIKTLKDGKRDLNRAIANSPNKGADPQVLYLRSLVNFGLNYFFDAIIDIEHAIENSDEAQANHYLARGRCYACLSMFKEAITDLSIAINLNKDLLDAYLNRGKCAYLIGDTGLAFMDFQKIIVIEPKNPMVHIYAGNLLMTTGSYEDATKAFTNADNIEKSALALYQRARCHVALNNMGEALKDLNKVIEIASTDKVAQADKECLNALKLASSKDGQSAVHDKSVYERALTPLSKLIQAEQNENLAKITHDSSVAHHHSQLIPSANRTRTDKIRAVRRRKEQDRQVREGKQKRNDLRFRVHHEGGEEYANDDDEYEDVSELDQDEIIRLNHQLEAGSQATQTADVEDQNLDRFEAGDQNFYKENIFNKEDYYLYRGVINCYAQNYDKALQDLSQSSQIMHANKQLNPQNQFPSSADLASNTQHNQSQHSSQTDLSDVGLCSLNIHEYTYNSLICLLCMKQFPEALEKINYLFDTIPKKYAEQLWLIRAQIRVKLAKAGGPDAESQLALAKKEMKRAQQCDEENYKAFTEGAANVNLGVFPQSQRLCSAFGYIKTPLSNGNSSIMLRPSFSFPFIKPPNMIPCVDTAVISAAFTSSKGQIPIQLKPEAPWIKKDAVTGTVKFTDDIYITDVNMEGCDTPESEREQRKKEMQDEEDQYAAQGAEEPHCYSQPVFLKKNIFV